MLKKKYNISLHFGNTQKNILEMDKIDVYYGLSEADKNALLWSFINEKQCNETQCKRITKDSKQPIQF